MGYGQIGDGNIHIKVAMPGYDNHELYSKVQILLDAFVLNYINKVGGSITAKLGVGQAYLEPI